MTTFYTALRYAFYVACVIPALLLLSSVGGNSTSADYGPGLMRIIIALVSGSALALIALFAGAVASSRRSPLARGFWIAAAIAAAPDVIVFIIATINTHH